MLYVQLLGGDTQSKKERRFFEVELLAESQKVATGMQRLVPTHFVLFTLLCGI